MSYEPKPVAAPVLTGTTLRLVTALLEHRATSRLLVGSFFRKTGIARLRTLVPDEPPTELPLGPPDAIERPAPAPSPDGSGSPSFPLPGVDDYESAYRAGKTDPVDVAERVLEAIRGSDRSDPPMRAFIAIDEDDLMAQARASSGRWRQGRPLSLFDGVPVAVKDELDQVPYPTTVGTSFLDARPQRDATPVARLRAAGALLIGKTNMHEIGLGVTGLNPHHGVVRNPLHPDHHTGGSSSGSAAAVASGICPIALGADGGGSIRLPAGLCGVVGLKPTFGRVSEAGAFPLCPSLGHVGPIGYRTRDVARFLEVIAGPDPADPNTARQPPLQLPAPWPSDLRGLRIGIDEPWFHHADPEVEARTGQALELFREMGAEIHQVELDGLDDMRVAQLVLIVTEMLAALDGSMAEHSGDFGLDVRLNFALARHLGEADREIGKRIRTRAMRTFARAFESVDLILTPATGRTAPPIRPAALPDGESDLATLSALMRFVVCGNLTGLPAIAFPVGYDPQGLPVGLQAIAPWWREDLALRLSSAAEARVDRRPPRIRFDPLTP